MTKNASFLTPDSNDNGLDSELVGGLGQNNDALGSLNFGDDLFSTWVNPETQTSNAVSLRIQEEYRKYQELNKTFAAINLLSLRGDWMSSGEMLMFVLLEGTAAYVHPIFFGNGQGIEREIPQTSGGTTRVSESSIMKSEAGKPDLFKIEVGQLLRGAGLIDVATHDKLEVILCGSSIIEPFMHSTITAQKLLGVASIDLQNTYAFKTKTTPKGALTYNNLTNCELELRINTTAEAYTVYGAPVFAPLVIEVVAKRKGAHSGLSSNTGQVIAKAYGYAEVERASQLDVAKLPGEAKEKPFLQTSFVVRSLSFTDGSTMPSPSTVLLVMSMLAHPTSVTLLTDKVIHYKAIDTANKYYHYPAIGYLVPTEGDQKPEPFTQIYQPLFADIQERARHAKRVFMPKIRVSFDVYDAQPYSSAFKVLATLQGCGKAMAELTGNTFGDINIGIVSTPLPYMTYVREDGKTRDVAELANTYSMLTQYKGKVQAISNEMVNVLGRCRFNQEAAKNMASYNEALIFIENRLVPTGNTELLGEFQRIHVNPDVLTTVLNKLNDRSVTFKYKDVSSNSTADLYALEFGNLGDAFSFNY